jgi:hypothetical protein
MATTQPTPGRWYVAENFHREPLSGGEPLNKINIKSDFNNHGGWDHPLICQVCTPYVEEAEANARILAAARELLENLERIVARIEENDLQGYFPSAYQRARDIILKAKEGQ